MLLSTYRYLERKIHVGGLPLAYWAQVLVGAVVVYVLAKLLAGVVSPSTALSIALTLVGMPLAASLVAIDADFAVRDYLISAIRWRLDPKVLLPGCDPAGAYAGYVLLNSDATTTATTTNAVALTQTALEDLWDRS